MNADPVSRALFATIKTLDREQCLQLGEEVKAVAEAADLLGIQNGVDLSVIIERLFGAEKAAEFMGWLND